MDCKKSNKIKDIVRLQQLLKKWKKLANTPPRNSSNSHGNSNGNINGCKSIKFLKRTVSLPETSIRKASSNTAVPRGYLAVSVGEEQKRYMIPTEYLSHPAFLILLQEAEQEFGFQQTGVLRIPCEVPVFERILNIMEEKIDALVSQECRFRVDNTLRHCSSTPSPFPQSPMYCT